MGTCDFYSQEIDHSFGHKEGNCQNNISFYTDAFGNPAIWHILFHTDIPYDKTTSSHASHSDIAFQLPVGRSHRGLDGSALNIYVGHNLIVYHMYHHRLVHPLCRAVQILIFHMDKP